MLNYRRLSNIELLIFSGTQLREEVNNSHIAIKAIIKYSLARIFKTNKSNFKSHVLFEEEFIHKKWKILDTITFNDQDIIFSNRQPANMMYFIEKGNIQLLTRHNRELKILKSGESFGESALLRGRKRINTAIAIGTTVLKTINSDLLSKEINKEPPLVQLALLCIIKRLEIMNNLRSSDHYNTLENEGYISEYKKY